MCASVVHSLYPKGYSYYYSYVPMLHPWKEGADTLSDLVHGI